MTRCTDGTDTGSKCTPNDTLTPSVRTSSGTGVNQTFTFQGFEDASKLRIAQAFQTTNTIAP